MGGMVEERELDGPEPECARSSEERTQELTGEPERKERSKISQDFIFRHSLRSDVELHIKNNYFSSLGSRNDRIGECPAIFVWTSIELWFRSGCKRSKIISRDQRSDSLLPVVHFLDDVLPGQVQNPHERTREGCVEVEGVPWHPVESERSNIEDFDETQYLIL